VLAFQDRVRNQVRDFYSNDRPDHDTAVARALWIAFEHEAMHLETLLYMLVQSEKTQPPNGTVRPDFEAMAQEAQVTARSNDWFEIPAQKFTIGMSDDENATKTTTYFGWDNEKPSRDVQVAKFSAKARPITNGEYANYLQDLGIETLPVSWTISSVEDGVDFPNGSTSIQENGNGKNTVRDGSNSFLEGKSVRTVFGKVPLKFAVDWPVMASYDELVGCAEWMGGRIPTLEEVEAIYEYVDELKSKELENEDGKKIPAVNGHLINDGVEESPPSKDFTNNFSSAASSLTPSKLFVNLEGANVGFKHWHPTPVVQNGDKLSGQGELGGVWEWTSSVLKKHEGFEPMSLYPGYTADFFDGKHNIVLGGSWATHPRIAGRKSFINWYQRKYLYVWAGARLVRDL